MSRRAPPGPAQSGDAVEQDLEREGELEVLVAAGRVRSAGPGVGRDGENARVVGRVGLSTAGLL